ncbi:MAG TPA: tetratricopeptide repeat protein [Verrucomicrobiota bacterium]|nr:tetratricopeptide repeat protein [Verrucomicrobiota bacterium]
MSSTTTTPPSPPAKREGEDFDFLTWFELNRLPLLIIFALICLGIAAFILYRANRRANLDEASRELLMLTPPTGPGETAPPVDPAKLLQLSQRFGGTPAGEQAQLLGAGQLFANGKYTEAQAEFAAFEDRYANSAFLGIAMLGVAAATEAQGKTNEAVGAYDRVIAASGSEAFAAQARLAKARLLATSQPAQALTLLDDVMKGPAAATYGEQAAMDRAQLLLQHPELVPPSTTTNSILVRPPNPAPTVTP